MANEVKVDWMLAQGFVLKPDGIGIAHMSNPRNLYDNDTKRSVLNFGNVQAGKTTAIKCVFARFSGASQVSDLQFWLDSTTANATGSTNVDLSKWEFYRCIVPQEELNFNIETTTTFTDAQKKGQTVDGGTAYLDDAHRFHMTKMERTVEDVAINQFPQPTTENQNASLILNIPADKGYADSYLIMLTVQTPTDANSGNTEGWYYRMNFLYS